MKSSKILQHTFKFSWVVSCSLIALGLYSLFTWSFLMLKGGWQMGVACFILLLAPGAIVYLFSQK